MSKENFIVSVTNRKDNTFAIMLKISKSHIFKNSLVAINKQKISFL